MKEKIFKILINASIGVLTSIASLYLGGSLVETVVVSGTATATVGDRVANAMTALFV